jgi:hypothetical protein
LNHLVCLFPQVNPSLSFSPYLFPSCRFIRSLHLQTTVLYCFPPFCAKNSTDCLCACVCMRAQICACMCTWTAIPLPPHRRFEAPDRFPKNLCVSTDCMHRNALCYLVFISHHG